MGPLTCSSLAPYCSRNVDVAKACPKTCGACSSFNVRAEAMHAPQVGENSTELEDNIWTGTIEFKNLPGNVKQAPWFNSPYHYRFDWQVWIETTASLERSIDFNALKKARKYRRKYNMEKSAVKIEAATQKMLPAGPPIPRIIRKMIDGVLSGNQDTIGLIKTSKHELLRCDAKNAACRPPTAVRARYFLYKYSSWKQLKDSGIWWTREPIARPQVLLKESQEESWIVSGRQLPWQRHWIALVAALGCAI